MHDQQSGASGQGQWPAPLSESLNSYRGVALAARDLRSADKHYDEHYRTCESDGGDCEVCSDAAVMIVDREHALDEALAAAGIPLLGVDAHHPTPQEQP